MIAIVDTGLANVGSMLNMFRRIGVDAVITRDPGRLGEATALVLPGVGAFDPGMETLKATGLIPVLERRVLADKVPLLGVCLGLQLIARGSEEGQHSGLGWIDADVVRFQIPSDQPRLKIPHMGWNELQVVRPHPLLAALPDRPRFYFVHSFHLRCQAPELVLATSRHGIEFPAVVAQGHVWGTQFHPEKSLRWGMALLRNFAESVRITAGEVA